jgi:hypothetical protein
MQVQDLKRWHWALIALVVGVALSYAWTNVEPTIPRSLGQATFEDLLVRPPHEGHAWLENLTVYPPEEGVYVVTGEQLTVTSGSKEGTYKPFAYMAKIPYVPGAGRTVAGAKPSAPADQTILTYLKTTAEQHAHVDYRYAWERKPAAVYAIWTVGSLVVIGGVWPSLVSLLTGGGLGLTRQKDDDDYDLSRFGSGKEAAPAGPTGPTTADVDQLKAVEAELEQKLAGFGITGATDAAGGTDQAGGVRKLDAQPLEAAPIDKPEEPKDYKGEFYPVARPGGAKHDE